MSRNSNAYIFGFATIITVICAIILGSAATVLKPLQDTNADVDKKSKVLMAIGEYKADLTNQDVLAFFEAEGFDGKSIEKIAFKADGSLSEGLTADQITALDLEKEMKKEEAERNYPIFAFYANPASKLAKKPDAYAMPIFGAGLWSTCYGFLALEGNATTVKGIIYYKHAETPGLGAEIKDNQAWVDQFKGKKFDANSPLVATKDPELAKTSTKYWAISGATFTLNGVDQMLTDYTKIYDKYLSTKRSK